MVPEGWRKLPVAKICDFQNGNGFKPSDWGTAGLPIIRIQNLNGSRSFNYFAGEPDARWIVNPGQLLFAWAGTKGVSFGPTKWSGSRGVLNQHIFKVDAREGIERDWLLLALRDITSRIETRAHGFKATLLHVKKSDIENQIVLVPPRDEQVRIAKVLATWEDAGAVKESLVASAKKLREALVRQLLTGKRRFGQFVRSAKYETTRYGSVPVDWRFVRVSQIASEAGLRNAGRERLPVLACSKHHGFVNSLEYFKKRVFSEDLSNYKIIRRFEFGFPSNHVEEGSIGFQEVADFGLVSPIYTVFKTSDEVVGSYLFKLLKSDHYRQIFASTTNGTVDRRGSLRWKEFKNIRIPLPSVGEQRQIASAIDTAQREVEILQLQLDKLNAEKLVLLQQLLTGKRRVKLDAAA